MATFDLATILSSISNMGQQLATDKAATQPILAENQQLREDAVKAAETSGRLESDVANIDAQQALTMERRKKATAEAFGVDMLDPENRVAMLAREQAASVDEYLTRSARAAQLSDMGLFDNPLEYMVARPFTARHQNAASAAANRANVIDKAITDLNQQAQATVVTQKAINEELSEAEAAAKAQLISLKADEAVRAARLTRNTAYLADLKTMRGMDEEQLKLSAEGYKLVRHEQEFNARMAEVQANRAARKESKKTADEELSYVMMRYNLGADMVGRAKAVNVDDFKAMMKFGNKKVIQEIIEKGESVWIDPKTLEPETRLVKIDETPGRSKVTLDTLGGRLPQSAERTSAYLQNEASLAQQNLIKAGAKKISPDEMAGQIDAQIRGTTKKEKNGTDVVVPGSATAMLNNVEQDIGRSTNIYRAPSYEVMATVTPSLTQNPAWKEILVPAVNASGPSPSANAVLKQAQIAIREGKIGADQAASFISTYFGTALITNNVNEQYFKVGLPVPKSYNAIVDTHSKWTGSSVRKLDLSNEQNIKHFLAQQSAPVTQPFGQSTPFGFN